MLTYTKLWILLEQKGMKRTDLKEVISGNTLAKLGKNEPISSTVIGKICTFLNCQPGDIMENITKEDIDKAKEAINENVSAMMKMLSETTGMSREAILNEFLKEAPAFVEKMKEGDIDIFDTDDLTKEE